MKSVNKGSEVWDNLDVFALRKLGGGVSGPGGGGSGGGIPIFAISLYDLSAKAIAVYSPTEAGFAAAIGAAASGDVIRVPNGTITGNHSIPAGVTVAGFGREGSIFSGQITMGDGAALIDAGVVRSVTSGAAEYGVIGPGSGAAYLRNCRISVSQAGAGQGYALEVMAGAVDSEGCDYFGTTAAFKFVGAGQLRTFNDRQSGTAVSGTANIVVRPHVLNKMDATAAPGVSDDSSKGYAVGSTWVDTSAKKVYFAADVSVGAAVWKEAGGSGGAALTVEEVDGAPAVANVSKIKVTNGSLTDNGAGIVTLTIGSATVIRNAVFTRPGPLFVGVGVTRVYNWTGAALTVSAVKAAVNTAPIGLPILIDVNIDGTTIFGTQANRPSIAAGAYEASSTGMSVTTIANGSYFTVDVDQVGSTDPGADLTVTIVGQ